MGPPEKSRLVAGIASAALNALILLALMTGLRVHLAGPAGSGDLIDVAFTAPPPPPPPQPPRPRAMPKRHRASAATGEQAAPIAAPVPRVPLAQPSVPAGTDLGSGQGSGSGTGGEGSGGGAGNGGSGEGSGDGDSDAEWIGGHIGNSDYPSRSADRGAQGTVGAEITVGVDGHVAGCRVVRSSGDADLDATTCRLVTGRFRFRPATDAAGHAIADTVDYEQEWVLNHR